MTSSTRFDSSSTSEIWSLLNALDDATVRVVATRAALLALQNPAAGMFAYQADYDLLWRYTGTQWRHFGIPQLASTAVRDAQLQQPLAGDRCRIAGSVAGTWVTCLHDGTAWRGVDWTALTVSSGISTGTLEYRLDDGEVEIRSTLLGGSLTTGTIYTVVTSANLPAEIKPKSGRYIIGQLFDAWGTGTGTAVLSATDGLQIKQSSGGTLTGNIAISFRYRAL